MTLVSQPAPNFIAPALLQNGSIINEFNLQKEIKNKLIVLFFWPMDFTFVCPTEIISLNNLYSEFQKRNTEIIGISRDSVFVHQAWKNTPINKGGIENIKYPLISDIKGEIQNSYNIMHPNMGISLRATFIIDSKWIIRHQTVNDLPYGRNILEIIRIIDCITNHEKNGYVCPANWKKGNILMHPSTEGIKKYYTKK